MSETARSARDWASIHIGTALGPVRDLIDYRRVIMNPATTLDYFPGHYDPEYARAVGHPTIFVNTMHFMGFIDRIVREWTGPGAMIERRTMRMSHPLYAGETMVGTGVVTRLSTRQPDEIPEGLPPDLTGLIDLDVRIENQDAVACCRAEVRISIPR